jgi:adenylate cyclase class 2
VPKSKKKAFLLPMTTSPIETEVKISVLNSADVLARLRSAGFRESVGRQFEANTLYDTPENRLRQDGTILRLRQSGDHGGVITWKGPGVPGPHKSRPELETTVGSVQTLHQILTSIGFRPSFRYEKYRTEFKSDDPAGVATLDETPIGIFLELEGPGDWIDKTAKVLGFSREAYILESYGKLYIADCERRGIGPRDMVFPSGS